MQLETADSPVGCLQGISTAPKELVNMDALSDPANAAAEYERITSILPATPALCIKPVAEGCSTGAVRTELPKLLL